MANQTNQEYFRDGCAELERQTGAEAEGCNVKRLVEPVSVSGDTPHSDYGGWSGFLATCELRDEVDGVRFFGKTNCNYIVFPDGELVQNFGYHGRALMSRIREEGRRAVLAEIQRDRAEVAAILKRLTVS